MARHYHAPASTTVRRLTPYRREMEVDLPSPADFPDMPPDVSFDVRGRNLDILFTFEGFPKPALSANKSALKRWQKERFERVFREDIRETEIVRALSQIELLGSMLLLRVAPPVRQIPLRRSGGQPENG